jgi:hypothetical protein
MTQTFVMCHTDERTLLSCNTQLPSHMQTPCTPRRTSQDGSTSLTRRGNHPLPLLEQRCFETVARAECIRFMARHQLLHWFQNYTQLYRQRGALTISVYCTNVCKDLCGIGGVGGWSARAAGGIKATTFYTSQLLK